MKITQNKQLALLFTFLSLMLAITLGLWLYKSGKMVLQSKIEIALKEAASEELDKRYGELGLPEYSPGAHMSNQKKTYIFTDKNGTDTFKIDLSSNKKRVTEAYNRRMEHTLLGKMEEIPLDSILQSWNRILQEAGIVSVNALQLHINNPNDSLLLISGDSTLCTSENKCTNSVYAGLSSEIELEPFIHCSWFSIIKNGHIGILAGINIVLILGFGVYIVISATHKKREALHVGNLRYHIKDKLFYVGSKKIHFSPQSEKLLLFLLCSPEFHATKHNIIIHLWEIENTGADDRLRQAASELRRELKTEKTALSIEAENGGYLIKDQKVPVSSKN